MTNPFKRRAIVIPEHDPSVLDHPLGFALANGVSLRTGSEDARRFVLAFGRPFQPAPLAHGMQVAAPGTCFQTAAQFVLSEGQIQAGFSYVEGFAVGPVNPLPLWHGWIERDGNAFDPTWPCTLDSLYFGVKFPTRLFAKIAFRRRYFGFLDRIDNALLSGFTLEAA